jgi:hypothetical protein
MNIHKQVSLPSVLTLVGVAGIDTFALNESLRQRLAECVERHLVAFVKEYQTERNVSAYYTVDEYLSDVRTVLSHVVKLAVRSAFGFVDISLVDGTVRNFFPAYDYVLSEFSRQRNRMNAMINDLEKIISESDSEVKPTSGRTGVWTYRPIESKVEPHLEFEARSEVLNDSLAICAKARGKSHKHEGTNCDDYFQVGQSGPWNIIAVSDGAGSKKFSRIGAKVATTGVVEFLKQVLASVDLGRIEFTKDSFGRMDSGDFVDESFSYLHNVLADAYLHAEKLVVSVCEEKRTSEESADYTAEAGHELEPNDFACTLLLAAHTRIIVDGKHLDLIFVGQVGDGLICLKSKSGTVQVIGQPDSGGFSGETEFITSTKMTMRESLMQRVNLWVGNMELLAVMTDGVADDYFPSSERAPALFCDLILNGALDLGTDKSELSTPSDDCLEKYIAEVESIAENPCKHKIASSQALSHHLSVTPLELLKHVDELRKHIVVDLESKPHDRLCRWLDLYQVRGSADDRTLVLLANGSI